MPVAVGSLPDLADGYSLGSEQSALNDTSSEGGHPTLAASLILEAKR